MDEGEVQTEVGNGSEVLRSELREPRCPGPEPSFSTLPARAPVRPRPGQPPATGTSDGTRQSTGGS